MTTLGVRSLKLLRAGFRGFTALAFGDGEVERTETATQTEVERTETAMQTEVERTDTTTQTQVRAALFHHPLVCQHPRCHPPLLANCNATFPETGVFAPPSPFYNNG